MDDQQTTLDGFTEAAASLVKKVSKPKVEPAAKPPRTTNSENSQIISYRHPDRRKNNPEVGVVSEARDPAQPHGPTIPTLILPCSLTVLAQTLNP